MSQTSFKTFRIVNGKISGLIKKILISTNLIYLGKNTNLLMKQMELLIFIKRKIF